MLHGEFHSPTKILLGDAWEYNLADLITGFSDRVLIVSGSNHARRSGLITKIESLLINHKLKVFSFNGVMPDPDSDHVRKGIDIVQKNRIGFILAVGGGSVIDAAKAIALGVGFEGDVMDVFRGKASPKQAVPVGAVVTLSGSGSESSDGAVIKDLATGAKLSCSSPLLRPQFAILDAELTQSVPEFLTACGIVDAISHVFERYFSNTDSVIVSDNLCEGMIRALLELGEKIATVPDELTVRQEIMWATKLAHDNTLGFGRKQDWASHTIAHELGARYKVTHGALLAVIFPAWMKYVSLQKPERFARLAVEVFSIPVAGHSDQELADLAIAKYRHFLAKIGMPLFLQDLNLDISAEFDAIADACSLTTQSGTIGNFIWLDHKDIVSILQLCAQGEK